jgi:hypothetical protein
MNDTQTSEHDVGEMNREEMTTALFAHLVGQQSNMAMMLMGKVPHPQTGETVRDIEAARLFIDQLEMIEAKTKGNLSKDEERLLKQALMTLRLSFVEAVEAGPKAESSSSESKPASKPATEPPSSPASEPETPKQPEEHRTKFSKKY